MGLNMSDAQRIEAQRAGLTMGPSNDIIYTGVGVWASAGALCAFKRASEGITGPVIGCISGPMREWAEQKGFGPPARLYRNAVPTAVNEEEATMVTFELPTRLIEIPSADAAGGRTIQLHISDAVLLSTHHWSGVLWANLLSLPEVLWRRLLGGPFRMAWKLPLAWLKTRSLEPLVLAGALNRCDKLVRIHPSAVVEGCWLQRGVQIGPGAVVRGCVLGENSRVEAQGLALFSVLGPGAVVQRKGWIQYGVAHRNAGVGGAMQLGVLGPSVSFKHGSYLMDQNLSQSVRVQRNGTLHTAPFGLIGVGVGAGSTIGSGVWIPPGRTVAPKSVLSSTSSDEQKRKEAEVDHVTSCDE